MDKKIWLVLLLFIAKKSTAQDFQPFVFQIKNLETTLEKMGSPMAETDRAAIENFARTGDEITVAGIEKVLEKYVLFEITVNPESRVSAKNGAARPILL